MLPALREDGLMKQRGERSALPASGEIGHAEIAHHGHTRRLGEIRRFANLQRGGRTRIGIVKHRLPVQADEFGTRVQCRSLLGVESPEVVVELREFVPGAVVRSGGVQTLLKFFGERPRPELEQTHREVAGLPLRGRVCSAPPTTTDLAQRVVHAVEAGAGHDAEDAHGRPRF